MVKHRRPRQQSLLLRRHLVRRILGQVEPGAVAAWALARVRMVVQRIKDTSVLATKMVRTTPI